MQRRPTQLVTRESFLGRTVVAVKAGPILLCAVFMSVMLLPVVHAPPGVPSPPYSWSGPSLIESYLGSGIGDVSPTALQASNGTLWLAFQSDLFNSQGGIFYGTKNTTGSWANARQLPFTSTGTNTSPYLAQLSDGSILLFWSLRTTGSTNIYYKRYIPLTDTWSSSVRVTTTSLNDTAASGALAADGTLWLFWQRSNKTCASCAEDKQVYYKTLAGGVWSSDVKLTSDANWNRSPSAMVGKDGKVRVVFSKGSAVLNNFQIYTTVYNGTTWSPQTQIVSSSSSDERPSIIQDRNGVISVFWGRQAFNGQIYYYVLYDKFSDDNGQSWSKENQMSSEASGITSQTPAAVQTNSGSDQSIRVFYASNRLNSVFDIYNFASPSIYPVHDVKISFVSPSSPLQYPGGLASIGQGPIVTVLVGVSNLGDFVESLQVSATISNRTSYGLGTQTGSISLGGFLSFSFNWNTTGITPARYTLSVSAVSTSGETVGNAGDNSLVQKNGIHIIPFGDVDQNGQVSLTDVSVFVFDFGASPGDPRWNPFCDINNSGFIDIIDVGVAVHNFGVVT